jgi:hypothetical protein
VSRAERTLTADVLLQALPARVTEHQICLFVLTFDVTRLS